MAVVISDRLLESSDRLLDAEPDEHLVRLAHSGHEGAFAAIVRRYEGELQAQARRLTSDGRGEDAVQQAFLNAFAALQRGVEIRHLRGWLHHILRNEVIRARVPVDAPLDAALAYGETLEDTVQRRATAHATLAQLSELPDRQRDALLGTAVFGFPRAHVARTMGLSEGAVRQLVHRARLRLRQAASALIPYPLFRLFGAARSGADAAPDAALGAGAAASGGLAIKVGALVASGVVATGIAVTQTFPPRHHAASLAPGARHHDHNGHTRAPVHGASASRSAVAPLGAALIATGSALDAHGSGLGREDGRSHGGPGRLSGIRSGRDGGSRSGRGRDDGRGHDGSSSGRGDDGPGRLAGGTSGRGSTGADSGSRSGSGSGSGDGAGSGGGRGGSGSRSGSESGGSGSGGGPSDSGSHSGSGTSSSASGFTSGSGSDDGATSTDGGHGSGSVTSTPAAAATSDATSGRDGGGSGSGRSGGSGSTSDGGSGSGSTSGSGSSGGSDGGSGSGSTESSGGSRDLSGSLDSSSS